MQGIVIAAHGSRSQDVDVTMQFIMQRVRAQVTEIPVELGYLGMGTPTIEEALEQLRMQGVHTITIIPYFLFQGMHVKETIPEIAVKFQQEHPELQVHVGKALGEDERLAAVLAQRIFEVL